MMQPQCLHFQCYFLRNSCFFLISDGQMLKGFLFEKKIDFLRLKENLIKNLFINALELVSSTINTMVTVLPRATDPTFQPRQ